LIILNYPNCQITHYSLNVKFNNNTVFIKPDFYKFSIRLKLLLNAEQKQIPEKTENPRQNSTKTRTEKILIS